MNKCKHCDREFHTPQGLGVHTYRMHTARGKKHSTKNRVVKSARMDHTQATLGDIPISLCFCPVCGCNLKPFMAAMDLL